MECFPKKTMSDLIMNQRNLHSSTMICYLSPTTCYSSYLPPNTSTSVQLFPAQLPSKAAASEAFLTGGNLFTHRPWWFICHAWHQHHQQCNCGGRHGHSEYLPQTAGDPPLKVQTKPSIWRRMHGFLLDRFGGLQSSSAMVGNCCLLPKVQLINGILLLCWNPWATICRSLGDI